jgi:hypothetical protein
MNELFTNDAPNKTVFPTGRYPYISLRSDGVCLANIGDSSSFIHVPQLLNTAVITNGLPVGDLAGLPTETIAIAPGNDAQRVFLIRATPGQITASNRYPLFGSNSWASNQAGGTVNEALFLENGAPAVFNIKLAITLQTAMVDDNILTFYLYSCYVFSPTQIKVVSQIDSVQLAGARAAGEPIIFNSPGLHAIDISVSLSYMVVYVSSGTAVANVTLASNNCNVKAERISGLNAQ